MCFDDRAYACTVVVQYAAALFLRSQGYMTRGGYKPNEDSSLGKGLFGCADLCKGRRHGRLTTVRAVRQGVFGASRKGLSEV